MVKAKKIKAFACYAAAVFIFAACQNPSVSDSGSGSSGETVNYTQTDYECLDFISQTDYVFLKGSTRLYDVVYEYDDNHAVKEMEEYKYTDEFDKTTMRGKFFVKHYKIENGVKKYTLNGEVVIDNVYLFYQLKDMTETDASGNNPVVYAFYQRFADTDHLYPIEECAFNPSNGGKVQYYVARSYTLSSKRKGYFEEQLPDSETKYFPGNLTAKMEGGTLNVTGDKKIMNDTFNMFNDDNLLYLKYYNDIRYNDDGTVRGGEDNVYKYYWNSASDKTYWFGQVFSTWLDEEALDRILNKGGTDALEKELIEEEGTMRVRLTSDSVSGKVISTVSSYAEDGWLQGQRVDTREEITVSGGKKINYLALSEEYDAARKLRSRLTATYTYSNEDDVLKYMELKEGALSTSGEEQSSYGTHDLTSVGKHISKMAF